MDTMVGVYKRKKDKMKRLLPTACLHLGSLIFKSEAAVLACPVCKHTLANFKSLIYIYPACLPSAFVHTDTHTGNSEHYSCMPGMPRTSAHDQKPRRGEEGMKCSCHLDSILLASSAVRQ